MQKDNRIMLETFSLEKHGHIVCYPRCTLDEFKSRLKELKRLHIEAIELTGQKQIHNMRILGKGHVGIVVTAHWKNVKVALKVRRIDADRKTMQHEAEMLKVANKVDVGPRLIKGANDFLIMEYVEGKNLPEWIETLTGKNKKSRLCHILRSALKQAWRLDEVGLDHGELSHAPKHIIVKPEDAICILDFETASISRRASNVTSLSQYIFLGSPIAGTVHTILGDFNKDGLMNALRQYKRQRSKESFQRVLEECQVHTKGFPLNIM